MTARAISSMKMNRLHIKVQTMGKLAQIMAIQGILYMMKQHQNMEAQSMTKMAVKFIWDMIENYLNMKVQVMVK